MKILEDDDRLLNMIKFVDKSTCLKEKACKDCEFVLKSRCVKNKKKVEIPKRVKI